ncbi:Mechanosensitive channel MscK precursor [Rubripirellula lacrimiformis]|uniref:Mechanosensitive channel MscK n=1 Tax=Rubripirellula lacrimiformis TaxID=1930273 RepID=A0A517NCD8_9BACT|nr:mechanosensitive ion channel domain-containing protein [Rubripirellula lacrimiformis]QDT04813.1 Mechanosensitive channel MscK precursor [Rubripirellula lacrimiformis]
MNLRDAALGIWLSMLIVLPVWAESDPPEPLTARSIQQKHDVVTTELRVALLQQAAEKEDEQRDPSGPDKPAADESQVDLLKQIDVIMAQQKTATASLQDAKSKQVSLDAELGRVEIEGVDGGPPYSILALDQLQDARNSGEAKSESAEASLLAARDSVAMAREQVESKQREFRQLKESTEAESDPKTDRLKLEVQLADEVLVLSRQQLMIEEAGQAIVELENKIQDAKLEVVKASVVFSKQILNEKQAELDVRESDLKRRASLIQSELQYAERRWLAARQELDSEPSPSEDLVQRVEALKTAQQTIQVEQTIINQRLQRLPLMRTAWHRRFLIASKQANRKDQQTWLEETNEQLEQIAREKQSKLLKLLDTREVQGAVAGRIDGLDVEKEALKRWLDATYNSLSRQVELYNGGMLSLDSATRALSRLKVDIAGTPARSLDEWISDSWTTINRLWNYELTSIDDTSLTVGKTVSSLLFLLFGYFAARLISSILGNRLPKIGVEEAGAHAIESLAFYALMIGFGLAALRYAHVPLTVFTFLGGAIAIGIGFGSQNILNNFISGLILLAERPIKAGDLIMVDDTYGNVKNIGARSTTIRTGENQDIIVPNSKFLENNVVNLTRRDDRLRTSIHIGVAYGSDLELVMQLLEQAATDNALVNDRPRPFVWFNDFGDNALAFQVHFWINARSIVQMRKVETEVRLAIDRMFRENGISIAFPQRDLHLMADNPIPIQMVGGENNRLPRS